MAYFPYKTADVAEIGNISPILTAQRAWLTSLEERREGRGGEGRGRRGADDLEQRYVELFFFLNIRRLWEVDSDAAVKASRFPFVLPRGFSAPS